jgi:UDP-N-acetylmuramyl-tripeptide synthetase
LIETGDKGFDVVVDYAHSPDGLENVLRSSRALEPKRLICVFGCGGDRDPTKRPKMGKIAADLSDLVVVTSDNPRSENPDSIIEQILTGIEDGRENPNVVVEVDRYEAIRKALCGIAEPGDLVVIAGKGHESGQQFADRKIPFDDRQVAREVLAACA